jgi:Na+/serine symporter
MDKKKEKFYYGGTIVGTGGLMLILDNGIEDKLLSNIVGIILMGVGLGLAMYSGSKKINRVKF